MHFDGVRSICSFIKMSKSDYRQTILVLKAPTGMVYNIIQAVYIGIGIMGYFCIRVYQTISVVHFVLYMCMHVRSYN